MRYYWYWIILNISKYLSHLEGCYNPWTSRFDHSLAIPCSVSKNHSLMSPRSHQTLNTEYINLHQSTWCFPKIGVPRNRPKIDKFSIEPSWLWGTHIFGNHHINLPYTCINLPYTSVTSSLMYLDAMRHPFICQPLTELFCLCFSMFLRGEPWVFVWK